MLNDEQRIKLLKIAREAIAGYLTKDEPPQPAETDPVLRVNKGAFVTITEGGELRGCIGHIAAAMPLCKTIRDMAG